MVLRTRTTEAQRDHAKVHGVSMSTVRARMEEGLPFEDAIACILKRRESKQCEAFGVRYPSAHAAAKDQGVDNPTKVYRRLRAGHTIESTITHLLERQHGENS